MTLDCVRLAIEKHGAPDEIIVVDNSPTDPVGDHGPEGKKGCSLQSAVCGLPLRWLRSRPLNKCAALNVGIAAAANEWLAFTDDDCLPDENWLCAAEAFAVGSGLRCFGGRVSPLLGGGMSKWLMPGRRGLGPAHGSIVRYEPEMVSGVVPRGRRKPLGANYFSRRDVFTDYGGYDEILWDRCGAAAIGCDDGEMMLRLDREAEPVGYCAEAVVMHPVYPERATLRGHLKAAFRLGYREPILSEATGKWRWTIRLLGEYLFLASICFVEGDHAAAVHYGEKAAVAWGSLVCRIRRRKPL